MKRMFVLLFLSICILSYGESVIHEKDGNVGIGEVNPQAKLDIVNYVHYFGNATKHYFVDYQIGRSTQKFGDPSNFYLLINRAETPGDSIPEHYIFGTITAVRGAQAKKDEHGNWHGGAWNRKAVIYIDSASAHEFKNPQDANRMYVKSIYEDWRPVHVTYKGVRYIALRPPVLSVIYALEFTGWAYVADGEMLKLVDGNEVTDITPHVYRQTVTEYANKKINGYIAAKEVVVTPTGWADDVFDPNYKMMGLKKLDKYISKNKHLPGIESGKNIEKNGLSIGNMQEKMIRKIEELTKYMIDQNKKMEKIEKENNTLRKRISQLETEKY